MERRSAIKYVLFMTGSVLLLPSCLREGKKNQYPLRFKNFSINEQQGNLLIAISETIIPATETPGAEELDLHLFVLKMLDDCHSEQDQKDFFAGLNEFEGYVKDTHKKEFTSCDDLERTSVLEELSQMSEPNSLRSFYSILKDRLINGYVNSEYVMTKLLKYSLIPNSYNGFVKLED